MDIKKVILVSVTSLFLVALAGFFVLIPPEERTAGINGSALSLSLAPPAVDIKANGSNGPITVPSGSDVTLSWTSNGSWCEARSSGSWRGVLPTSGTQRIANLKTSASFMILCRNAMGSSVWDTVNVNVSSAQPPVVPPAPAPVFSFVGNHAMLRSGGSPTLMWAAPGATSCVASGAWSGQKPVTGSQTLSPISVTSTYTLTCAMPGGAVSKSATISVAPIPPAPAPAQPPAPPAAPVFSFNSDRSMTRRGTSPTLMWAAPSATSCTASGAWSGPKPVTGSQSVGPVSVSGVYTLTCVMPGGPVTKSVTITVQ